MNNEKRPLQSEDGRELLLLRRAHHTAERLNNTVPRTVRCQVQVKTSQRSICLSVECLGRATNYGQEALYYAFGTILSQERHFQFPSASSATSTGHATSAGHGGREGVTASWHAHSACRSQGASLWRLPVKLHKLVINPLLRRFPLSSESRYEQRQPGNWFVADSLQ